MAQGQSSGVLGSVPSVRTRTHTAVPRDETCGTCLARGPRSLVTLRCRRPRRPSAGLLLSSVQRSSHQVAGRSLPVVLSDHRAPVAPVLPWGPRTKRDQENASGSF